MKLKRFICVLKNALVGVISGLLDKLLNALLKKLTAFKKRVSALRRSIEEAAASQNGER